MASSKISALTLSSALAGSEMFPSALGGANFRVTTNQIRDYVWASPTLSGTLTLPNGTLGAPSLVFANSATSGLYGSSGSIAVAVGGVRVGWFDTAGFQVLNNSGYIGIGAASDTMLYRDAAAVLALRNGVSTQTFRVYNTYTDASNYARLNINFSGTTAYVGHTAAGTGTATAITLDAPTYTQLATAGTVRWYVDSSSFRPNANNTYDAGSTTNTLRSVYVGTNVVIGFSTTSTAQLHVGAGADLDIYNGALGSLSPQIINSQTSGAAAIGAAVYDGTFNRRVGLFVDNTNSIWGLSLKYSSTTIPFVIIQSGVEQLRLDTSGNLGLGNPTAITYRLDVKGSYQTIVSRFLRSADYGEVIRVGRDGVAGSAGIGYPEDNTLSFLTAGTERLRVSSSGHLLAGADATYDWGASGANRPRDLNVARNANVASSVNIGGTATTGATSLGSFGNSFSLIGATSLTDTATKSMRVGLAHYTNAEEPMALLVATSSAGANTLNIGGGVSLANAATDIIFYTAANNTTTTGTGRWGILSNGTLYPVADATYDIGASSAQARDAYLSRYLKIGGAAPAGAAGISSIQSFGQNWSLISGDVLTDAATKFTRLGLLHYLAAEEPVVILSASSSSTANTVQIGGGTGFGNAATSITFWTAANTTTLTGTQRWQIDSTGDFFPGATNSYNFGWSGGRIKTLFVGTAVDVSSGTITTSAPALNIAQTWNAGGVTFTGALINVTNTASASGSLLQDWQVGGVSMASIRKDGKLSAVTGDFSAAVNVTSSLTVGASNAVAWLGRTILRAPADGSLRILNNAESISATLVLETGALTLRDATNSQTFRAYATYTDASNYERVVFIAAAGGGTVGWDQAGTGSARNFSVRGNQVVLQSGSSYTNRWILDTSGHWQGAADVTYDIGAVGARVRNFIGRNLDLSYTTDGANIISVVNVSTGASARAGLTMVNDGGSSAFVALHGSGTASGIGRGNALVVQGPYSAGVVLNATHASGVIEFVTGGTGSINTRWRIDASGHLLGNADNTYDIGASGSNRPRSVYTGGTIYSGNGYYLIGTGRVEWGGRSLIQSPVDGVLALYNNALTGFTGIKFGGVTSSQPYLKVNGAEVQFRTADDLGFTKVQGQLKTHANAVAETPTATHTLTLYDAAGTAYRVLCVV